MEISRPLAIVIGSGITLLILKEVFNFVRWILKKNPGSKGEEEPLERIEKKIDGVVEGMSGVRVDMGIVKTKVDFFGTNQKAQWDELKEVTEKLEQIPQKFAEQVLKCERRFGKLETSGKGGRK